ncbi:MAG TPA: undecaprenyl-phosphate glucose phosphotransferase [Hyphomicrobiaceae bacterium]|nr:undecaprenyl-phosphate glucose phosphotransferase [Hyphomicrobiaceae bacterium]
MSNKQIAARTGTEDESGNFSRVFLTERMPPLADFQPGNRASLISPAVLAAATRGFEFLLTAIIGFAIALIYVDEPALLTRTAYPAVIVSLSITTLITFELLGLYTTSALSSIMRQMPRVAMGWTAAFAALLVAIFFMKLGQDFSRGWLAVWFVSGGMALLASRLVLSRLIRRWAKEGRLYRRAVIYGSGAAAEQLISELEAKAAGEIRISGVFDERDDERCAAMISGYPRLGGLTQLVDYCRKTRIDLAIVALPITAESRLAQLMKQISVLPVDIKLPAAATSLRFSPRTYSRIGEVAMIDLHDTPITDWGRVSKWMFDKVTGGLALVLLAPVMAMVAVAIKLDSRGPVFFRQKRYGFNNELIEVYKFRSMYVEGCDATASKLVTKDDPRVTKVGRFIRKTSLDELPQLINVLKGNLSLVGPRPHALHAKAANQLYDEAVEGYFARHKVKPGITGWAQINGWRGETDTHEKIQKRVECDLYYIENWSVFFDLYILLKTPFALLKSENAY